MTNLPPRSREGDDEVPPLTVPYLKEIQDRQETRAELERQRWENKLLRDHASQRTIELLNKMVKLPCGHPAYICDECEHPHCPIHGSLFNDEQGLYQCPRCHYSYGLLMQMEVGLYWLNVDAQEREHTGDQVFPS